MNKKVLVVEDEPTIADAIKFALTQEGYEVQCVSTLGAARGQAGYVLMVLDVGLPDGNGLDFCKELRKSSQTPIIFLTARGEEVDKIVGLELGADDYVVKPFSPRELAARVKAVLRRTETPENNEVVGGLAIREDLYDFSFNNRLLKLARYEFRVLAVLYGAPGRVFTREQLMNAGWEDPQMSLERTVDAHIKTIRSKIRQAGGDPEIVSTHRGIGYSLIKSQ